MLVKTFIGKSCSDALQKARETLGEHAIVLETRRTTTGVEVVAAAQRPRAEGEAGNIPVDVKVPRRAPTAPRASSAVDSSSYLNRVSHAMERQGFSEALIRSVVSRAQCSLESQGALVAAAEPFRVQDLIAEVIPGARPEDTEPRVVVMVGPPGVGKTTTIAKIAAHERLTRGRPVAIASCDDQRLDGAGQIARYAQVLEVPFHMIHGPDDLERARRSAAGGTLLVDTPGVSRLEKEGMQRLAEKLCGVSRDEIELLLAADTDAQTLIETAARFQAMKPGFVGVTRTDEAVRPGEVVTALSVVGLPIRHVGCGPRVPNDLGNPDPSELASWALPPERLERQDKEIASP